LRNPRQNAIGPLNDKRKKIQDSCPLGKLRKSLQRKNQFPLSLIKL
jgi:hypothetical protein